MKKISLIFLFQILTCFIAIGSKPDSSIKSTQVAVSKPDTNVLSEGKAYKMLYENEKSANERILSTIYYALSGLGVAILFVFGSNWWFNDKKVKDLRDSISAQITNADNETSKILTEKINSLSAEKTTEISKIQIKLQEEVTASITNLTSKFNDFTNQIRSEIKTDNNQLTQNFQQNLEAFTTTYNQQINSLQTLYEERISGLKDTLSNTLKSETTERLKLEKRLDTTEKEILCKLYRVDANGWGYAGVHRNSLMSYVNECQLRIELDQDVFLSLYNIEEQIKLTKEIWQSDKDLIISTLNQIKNTKYNNTKEIILERLNKLKITE